MFNPTPESIKRSRSKLQKGVPLFQQDIFNIARKFKYADIQYPLLKGIHARNQQLAESFLIFRKRIGRNGNCWCISA
jgi:hypothetical protein